MGCCCYISECYEQNLQTGLPNIGNTCYLNVILQMLYSADEFKKVIIHLSKVRQKLEFHKLLANIFIDIQENKSLNEKRRDLELFSKNLQKKQPRFAQFQQNDATQCLLSILNILEQEYQKISKLNLFKVQYTQSCNCSDIGIMEGYIITPDGRCLKCNKQYTITIHSSGKYLFNISKPDKGNIRLQVPFSSRQSNYLLHEVRSFVLYRGNKQSGHYIMYRKQLNTNKWLKINDSRVQVLTSISETTPIPMISLYQKKEKNIKT